VTTPIADHTDAARVVVADFQGLVLQSAFAPLAKSMGFYGDIVVGIAARAIARNTCEEFTNTLERAISSS
jgi:hypothetical protein